MSSARGSILAVFALCAGAACGPSGAAGGSGASGSAAASSSGVPAALEGQGACKEKIARLRAEAALPGAPAFEERRIDLMGRPRGTPLLWRRAPVPDPSMSASSRSALAKIEGASRPLPVIKGIVRRYARSPEVLRGVFLRENYVYSDDPEIALAIVETVRLTHLFREPEIHLLRGAALTRLRRAEKTRAKPEGYVYDEGPFRGEAAELLLGDRVAVERADLEKAPLALDLSGAAAASGLARVRAVHLSETGMVAEVRAPGGPWVTAAFDVEGPGLSLACVDGSPEALLAHRAAAKALEGQRAALAKIVATVRAEVEEEPPFDEPRDEPDGEQQDGALRREWRRAYTRSLRKFTVGDVSYDVYDAMGRPVPPQVCVDFITDTWERASGTWYRPLPPAPEGERPKPAPERTIGGVDFDQLDLANRRSVAELVSFAKRHEDMFEVLDLPPEGRIPFARRADFFAYLAGRAEDFAPGDVLVIHGLKDDGRPHYHSVMILEQDPLTGVPVRVAGNAGRPREQTLEGVMARSPKRSIKHRIRPRPAWLSAAIGGGKGG